MRVPPKPAVSDPSISELPELNDVMTYASLKTSGRSPPRAATETRSRRLPGIECNRENVWVVGHGDAMQIESKVDVKIY